MAKRTLTTYLWKNFGIVIAISLCFGLILAFFCKNWQISGLLFALTLSFSLGFGIFCIFLFYQLQHLQKFLDNSENQLDNKIGLNPFFEKSALKIQKISQEKQELSERHQQLDTMRKDFVANVSHELRTPLTVLMGYLETFSEQPDLEPRWQRAFSQMSQQSLRMKNIINDLLLLSKLENDNNLGEMKEIDMPRLLTQLFDDAQAQNRDFEHLIHLEIDSQAHLQGYEDYLTSALNNLIANAIKYTPKGGEIHIRWTEQADGYHFSVSDNGIGIAPEHIERLTERFYRVDSGRSRETGGTGLGLAIVKHVLNQHHAKLHITSQIGKSSTFSIIFPK